MEKLVPFISIINILTNFMELVIESLEGLGINSNKTCAALYRLKIVFKMKFMDLLKGG